MPAKAKISGSVGMHRSEAEGTRERSEAPEGAARRCAGFPSPAEQYLEPPLDLNELLVKRPAATYFVRVPTTGGGECTQRRILCRPKMSESLPKS